MSPVAVACLLFAAPPPASAWMAAPTSAPVRTTVVRYQPGRSSSTALMDRVRELFRRRMPKDNRRERVAAALAPREGLARLPAPRADADWLPAISDSLLATRCRRALADDALLARHRLGVTVRDGRVAVAGAVPTAGQRRRIARTLDGIAAAVDVRDVALTAAAPADVPPFPQAFAAVAQTPAPTEPVGATTSATRAPIPQPWAYASRPSARPATVAVASLLKPTFVRPAPAANDPGALVPADPAEKAWEPVLTVRDTLLARAEAVALAPVGPEVVQRDVLAGPATLPTAVRLVSAAEPSREPRRFGAATGLQRDVDRVLASRTAWRALRCRIEGHDLVLTGRVDSLPDLYAVIGELNELPGVATVSFRGVDQAR